MAGEDIYVTKFLAGTELVLGTKIDRSEPGWQAVVQKRTPTQSELPLKIYAKYKDEDFKGIKEVFEGAGGTKVSEKVAAILRSFDLGQSKLLPVQLYFYDRKTPLDAKYHVIYGYDVRKLVVPEQCVGIRPYSGDSRNPDAKPPVYWNFPWDLKDNDIAIVPRGLDGLDIWTDPALRASVFMSGPLAQALVDAGCGRYFKFAKCKTLPVH